jgi:hypothetical protein
VVLQICIDPCRLFEHGKLEYDEMKTLIIDNFVSMVRARKFSLGDISDFMIVDDAIHMCNGKTYNVCSNLVTSASIYLPWNNTVATTITWNLKHLSQYFAIYPLKSEQMGNNILYNITWFMCQEENIADLKFDRLTFNTVINEASRNKLDDRFGVHARNLHLLDSIYGLKNIDYVCLKVLGCHHNQFEHDGLISFGWNCGGYYCPLANSEVGHQGFQIEPEDDTTSDDDIIFLKNSKKGGQSKFFVFYVE